MKKILKIMLTTFVYSLLFIISNAIMPYSEQFKQLNSQADPSAAPFMFVNSLFVCLTIYYIVKNSKLQGLKLVANVSGVMFFIQTFMTQIETMFFGHAFALTKTDMFLIIAAGILPIVLTTMLTVKLFKAKSAQTYVKTEIDIKDLATKIAILSVVYLCVYFFFGYFVAWQFEQLRIFYTGSAEKLGFIAQLINNIKTNPVIFPFQIFRGVLFTLGIVPLYLTIEDKKKFIVSVCLVYLCTAIVLVVPNVLFPDAVRIGHLCEMTSSMLLFGLIVGFVFKYKK